jgi:hypothetical protein
MILGSDLFLLAVRDKASRVGSSYKLSSFDACHWLCVAQSCMKDWICHGFVIFNRRSSVFLSCTIAL